MEKVKKIKKQVEKNKANKLIKAAIKLYYKDKHLAKLFFKKYKIKKRINLKSKNRYLENLQVITIKVLKILIKDILEY